jgi:hypothetical protein
LRNGTIGLALTPTGMPARDSASMVFSRRAGDAARGLHRACQQRVQRGQRNVHRGQVPLGHRRDQVDVAFDQAALGEDRERVPGFAQNLDDSAGDLQAALGRLVGVCHGADVEHQRRVATRAQSFA